MKALKAVLVVLGVLCFLSSAPAVVLPWSGVVRGLEALGLKAPVGDAFVVYPRLRSHRHLLSDTRRRPRPLPADARARRLRPVADGGGRAGHRMAGAHAASVVPGRLRRLRDRGPPPPRLVAQASRAGRASMIGTAGR